ncbi:MAG: DUF5989 family protein [archaeon]
MGEALSYLREIKWWFIVPLIFIIAVFCLLIIFGLGETRSPFDYLFP